MSEITVVLSLFGTALAILTPGCLQIAWEYIYTFPVPLVAKTLALGSANGTAVNTFYLRSSRLANSNDTAVVTPNHDTIYSQAWLDLSQVPGKVLESIVYPVPLTISYAHHVI